MDFQTRSTVSLSIRTRNVSHLSATLRWRNFFEYKCVSHYAESKQREYFALKGCMIPTSAPSAAPYVFRRGIHAAFQRQFGSLQTRVEKGMNLQNLQAGAERTTISPATASLRLDMRSCASTPTSADIAPSSTRPTGETRPKSTEAITAFQRFSL